MVLGFEPKSELARIAFKGKLTVGGRKRLEF